MRNLNVPKHEINLSNLRYFFKPSLSHFLGRCCQSCNAREKTSTFPNLVFDDNKAWEKQFLLFGSKQKTRLTFVIEDDSWEEALFRITCVATMSLRTLKRSKLALPNRPPKRSDICFRCFRWCQLFSTPCAPRRRNPSNPWQVWHVFFAIGSSWTQSNFPAIIRSHPVSLNDPPRHGSYNPCRQSNQME